MDLRVDEHDPTPWVEFHQLLPNVSRFCVSVCLIFLALTKVDCDAGILDHGIFVTGSVCC